MATMYVSGCDCRRRQNTADTDVVEPWFLLSRASYQRILDVALADMTSAEVLQHAYSTSRGSELLRLLKAGDDDVPRPTRIKQGSVEAERALSWPLLDRSGVRPTTVTRDTSDKSVTCVHNEASASSDRATTGAVSPTPAVTVAPDEGKYRAKRRPSKDPKAAAESDNKAVGGLSAELCPVSTSSAQPLCLRACNYSRRRQSSEAEPEEPCFSETTRQLTSDAVSPKRDDAHKIEGEVSVPVIHTDDTEPTDSGLTQSTSDEQLRRSDERQLEPVDCEESRYSTKNRSGVCRAVHRAQPHADVADVDTLDCDGWAPIDKDILVEIVERLSVSCLEPTSCTSVAGQRHDPTTASTSLVQFRQPLTTPVRPTPGSTASRAGTRSDADAMKQRDPMKRSSISAASATKSAASASDKPPPYKTQRLLSPPASLLRAGSRRKQRRVQVRDTWNVPMVRNARSLPPAPSSASDLTMHQLMDSTSADPRHVWAPLEKSVVLNVIDHILVDSEVDQENSGRDHPRRCDVSARHRWLKPPTLQAIGTTLPLPSAASTTETSSDSPVPGATEASFKWKSNILLRMRKEQTTVATSGGHWLSLAPSAVAATGS